MYEIERKYIMKKKQTIKAIPMIEYLPITNQPIMGVYEIVNTVNGHRYVGQSHNIYRRFIDHKTKLNSEEHYNPHLQSAWKLYREDKFIFNIIEIVDHKENLTPREQYYIDEKSEYNIEKVAGGSPLGIKHSEEAKIKHSQVSTGSCNPMYGKSQSEESNRKNREKNKARWGNMTPEEKHKHWEMSIEGKIKYWSTYTHKEKQYISMSFEEKQEYYLSISGSCSPMYGKHHTEESRKKISQSQMGEKNFFYGKKHKEESIQKNRETNNKYWHNMTPEEKQKHKEISKQGLLRWREEIVIENAIFVAEEIFDDTKFY